MGLMIVASTFSWKNSEIHIRKCELNKRYNYLLRIRDVFWKIFLDVSSESETGSMVTDALENTMNNRTPKNLWIENGTEFYSKTFETLMEQWI